MVSSSSPTRVRNQGVVQVNNAPNSAPIKTLMHCVPVQMFALEFGDESGARKATFVFKVGDVIYSDPNGEQWAANLRTVPKTSWLHKQITEAAAALEKSDDVPKQDAVDIMGGDG